MRVLCVGLLCPGIVIQYFRNPKEVAISLWRIGQCGLDPNGLGRCVLAQAIADGQTMGQGLDVICIEFTHLVNMGEDSPQLPGELLHLRVAEVQTRQLRYLAHLGFIYLLGYEFTL